MTASFRGEDDEVEAQVLYEKVLKEATLRSHGRAELLEAVQHHPESPYRRQHDHPVEEHIAAVRRDMDAGTVIVDEMLKSDLTARQREEIEKYAAERRDYLESGVMPACRALLAGDFGGANEIVLRTAGPVHLPLLEDAGLAGTAGTERTLCTLSLFFGAVMALSFLVMTLA